MNNYNHGKWRNDKKQNCSKILDQSNERKRASQKVEDLYDSLSGITNEN